MNNIKKLPDAYLKSPDSNLYNLLQLLSYLYDDVKGDFASVDNSRDFSTAYGQTLDYYGAMVGESRNGATDEQFRVKILNRIGQCVSESDCDSIINAIARMLGVEASTLSLSEEEMSVTVKGLNVAMLGGSGYSTAEINKMIETLLPIGVKLGATLYKGTLLITRGKITAIGGVTYDVLEQYPYLWRAWREGQASFSQGEDIGLSGTGEVPDSFLELPLTYGMKASGTYSGGTLSTLLK